MVSFFFIGTPVSSSFKTVNLDGEHWFSTWCPLLTVFKLITALMVNKELYVAVLPQLFWFISTIYKLPVHLSSHPP